MAKITPCANVTLSYPLYACDFDPFDPTRLVVGGGGGAGRSGVGNKITLLDSSKSTTLVEVAEIDLSKSEDNVASLAVGGQRNGQDTVVYTGVNSSPSDVEKGRNLHFRTFGIEQGADDKEGEESTETKATAKITELSKSSLFTVTETGGLYQRILRLSRPYPDQTQLGAVATGLAKQSELVVFDTSSPSQPKSRAVVKSDKEIEDVALLQTGDSEYLVAYCDEYDIYVKRVSSKIEEDSDLVYITPGSRDAEKPTVPKFRALKWLTKEHLLTMTNIHSNGGAVLQILRVPQSGKGQCRVVRSHQLPSNVRKASGLAVSNLTPPLSPSAPQDYTQFVIGVAAQDQSISLLKVDLQIEGGVSNTSEIKPFRTLKSVHAFPITSITFSNFTPPAHPITANTPPQYLKLASVSVGNTVTVHTLPLFPVPLSVKKGQSRTPRYVVAIPSDAATFGFVSIVCFITIAVVAMLLQGVLEIRGAARPYLNAPSYVPVKWQPLLVRPYGLPEKTTLPVATSPDSPDTPPSWASPVPLHQLIERAQSEGEGTVIVHDLPDLEGVKATLHAEQDESHGAKSWEDLSRGERELWKKKLKDAGHWAEDFGETILKGVLFGEFAGAVAQAI